MKCTHCGTDLPDEAVFCYICGARIDTEEPEKAAENNEPAEEPVEDEASDVEDMTDSEAEDAPEDDSEGDEQADGEGEPDEGPAEEEPAADSEDEPELDATVAADALDVDFDSIPDSMKLEEPLSPFGAGAVPMVPVAPPPRAMRMGANTRPRTYTSYGEQPSAARAFAAAHQAHAAEAVRVEEPPASEEGEAHEARTASEVLSGVGEGLKGLGDNLKDRASHFSPSHGVVVGVGVLVVAVLAFVLVRTSAGWFSPFADRTQTAPQVQPPSDGSVDPIQPQEEEPEAQLPEDAPAAKASVEDYSWDELSQISALIAAADSDDAARELAVSYNLCAADGTLDGTQTKELQLVDGTSITMRVAGFRQDQKADGSGVAGISFIAADSVAERSINHVATTEGGWEACELREWISSTLVGQLPADLAGVVVPVSKSTNAVAGAAGGLQVTTETLWIPSYSELVGELDSYNKRTANYQSEGAQYQLFANQNVTWNAESNAILVPASGAEYWWLRSPDVSNSTWFMCVTPTGMATWGHKPGTQQGVLIGFCL